MASTLKPPLPSVRRVVTGHTPSGKSTVLRDTVQPPQYWSPGSINPIYDLCRTDESPTIIGGEVAQGEWVDEIARDRGHVSKGGSVFRAFDFSPGTVTPFHRTVSLDYGVIARGSITLELDDGERVTLNEGDTIIQRGTIHNWRNETDEWTRIYFVVLGAHPVEVNGQKLGEEWQKVKE